ncbi:LysR family transcriptional regulator [Frateuria aurantia]
MDDLVALHIFARCAELGSFSKAALGLGVKTSTVSRHIRQLEQKLGIALFNRSTRALALTEGGRTLWRQLAPALLAIEQACRDTEALNRQPRGRLRLTAPYAYARCCLLPLLPRFMHSYPDITIETRIDDAIIPMIDQEIDVAIRLGVIPDSSLKGRRLAPLDYRLVADPGYLLRRGPPVSPAELQHHACLLQGFSGPVSWHFSRGSADKPASYPIGNARFRSNDVETLRQMAVAGEGLALLPDWLVADDCRDGRLLTVLDDWTIRPQPARAWIWALYPPKTTVSSKVRAFIDFYAAQLDPATATSQTFMEN